MNSSLIIAKLMGPVMLVSGVALLVNKQLARDIFDDFIASPALIFIAGVMALIIGVTIVTFHNIWSWGWPVVITVFGWMAVASGIVRMVFPAAVKQMGAGMIERPGLLQGLAVLNIALGAFLTYQGFWA